MKLCRFFELLVSCCPNLLKTAVERKVNPLVSRLTRQRHATHAATGQTRGHARFYRQMQQQRRSALLRHVPLHVNIRHCAATYLAVRWFIFWFRCNLMQAFLANYTSRCVFGTVGRPAGGGGSMECCWTSPSREPSLSLRVVNLTTCSTGRSFFSRNFHFFFWISCHSLINTRETYLPTYLLR